MVSGVQPIDLDTASWVNSGSKCFKSAGPSTFGLKGGVSLLWYRSSQFMGLKNTWFFMSSCREKTLVSSPHHSHSPTGAHNWPPTRQNSAALAGLLSPESILLTNSSLMHYPNPDFPLQPQVPSTAGSQHPHPTRLGHHVCEQDYRTGYRGRGYAGGA